MALVVADRVKETTTTTGTGAITLAGAETNFVTFSSVLSNADTTYYAIVDNTNSAFEVGLGTYASSGNTITRTTIISSSNSNNAVDLQAGSKDVFVTLPSNKFPLLDGSGNVDINGGTIDGTTIGGSSAAAGTFTTFTSTGIDDNASSTAITITSGNDVGVGVTSPRTGYRLDVQESADNGVNIQAGNASSDIALAVGSASTADKVVVEAGGNVGIGGSPSGILHLKSDDNGMIFQSSSSSNSRAQIFFQNTGGTTTGKIAVDPDGGNADVMAFSTGSTERLRIDNTGAVAIGGSTFIGSRAKSLSVVGDDDSSTIASKTTAYDTVFSVLPWSGSVTYIGTGTYYDDGSWVHASDNALASLFALAGDGAHWYASSGSTVNHDVASNVPLWNSTGQWDGDINTTYDIDTGAISSGKVTITDANYDSHLELNRSSEQWRISPSTDGSLDIHRVGGTGTARTDIEKAADYTTADHFLLPNADNSTTGNLSTAKSGGAINYIYNRGSNVTLTRGDFSHHIIQQWSGTATFTITSSTFLQGDVIEFVNVRGTVTITVVGTRIYLPSNTYDTTLTLSQAGKFRLLKYSTSAGYWMVG